MNVKDLQPTYTMRDMAKMFRRVDELTRANNMLTTQLATAQAELAQAKSEIADLTTQVDDMQGDLVRQMTAPRVLPTERHIA
jgi:outer membrane protein TolC